MKIRGGVLVVVVDGSGWKWPERKRETERKGNTPVNTGPSPNSDGRANNLVEEADEPARHSGPLQCHTM
ncbi:hypothetical protein T12_16223 [Trichinella patagoniensis]|uniref:Uncharacterized protein n=1 Tax=Trichinella patagoniensis TaxID=990121 RepID=A0A0V0Z1M8_9BILA|nr:hypothetical protein T12_5520 [Trichinella patagoniensis]KRY06485.1 hypothetical protein T12_16223 [Trichinella patagoniensis]